MHFNFINSVIALQKGSNNVKCGLKTLCKEIPNEEVTHSARKDVILLKRIFELSKFQCMLEKTTCTFNHLSGYLNAKLPLSFDELKTQSENSNNREHLCFLLWPYVKKHTALNEKLVYKIACIYFKKRYFN